MLSAISHLRTLMWQLVREMMMKDIKINAMLPKCIFGLWDSQHYLHIAENGYNYEKLQLHHAFFPLYPFLIHIFTLITRNEIIAGLLISNSSFILALILFSRYLRLTFSRKEKWQLYSCYWFHFHGHFTSISFILNHYFYF